ncbi:hypothetical protein N8314_00810 [Akkermansiaceae bacterium]|nr:hypothetical protein [Akkermansiaceae bacterium]
MSEYKPSEGFSIKYVDAYAEIATQPKIEIGEPEWIGIKDRETGEWVYRDFKTGEVLE